jgi:hypothetical protein
VGNSPRLRPRLGPLRQERGEALELVTTENHGADRHQTEWCADATAKYLGRHVDVLEVVWARYTFGFLLGRSALLLGPTVLNFFAIKWPSSTRR